MPFLVAARPCSRLALNYLDTWQYICCQYKLAVGYCCQYIRQLDILSTDDVSGSVSFVSPGGSSPAGHAKYSSGQGEESLQVCEIPHGPS